MGCVRSRGNGDFKPPPSPAAEQAGRASSRSEERRPVRAVERTAAQGRPVALGRSEVGGACDSGRSPVMRIVQPARILLILTRV
jgi:hypothetical protein